MGVLAAFLRCAPAKWQYRRVCARIYIYVLNKLRTLAAARGAFLNRAAAARQFGVFRYAVLGDKRLLY